MRLKPRRHDHAIDGTVRFEDDLAFRDFEIEGPALLAGAQDRPIGGVKRLKNFIDDRFGDLVGAARNGELRLLVTQSRRTDEINTR